MKLLITILLKSKQPLNFFLANESIHRKIIQKGLHTDINSKGLNKKCPLNREKIIT